MDWGQFWTIVAQATILVVVGTVLILVVVAAGDSINKRQK